MLPWKLAGLKFYFIISVNILFKVTKLGYTLQ